MYKTGSEGDLKLGLFVSVSVGALCCFYGGKKGVYVEC